MWSTPSSPLFLFMKVCWLLWWLFLCLYLFFLSFSSDICDWKWNWDLMIFEIWFWLFFFCWLFWNWVWIELFHISILFYCCCFWKGGDDLNWIMLMVMREVGFCWLFFKLFIFISGKSIFVGGLSSERGRRSFSYKFPRFGERMFINCWFSQIPFLSLFFWRLTLEIQRCVFYHQHWRSIHLSLCWISHLLNTQ